MASFEYPLTWPAGFARTAAQQREWTKFSVRGERGLMRDPSAREGYDRVMAQVLAFTRRGAAWRVDPDRVIFSTNMRVRKSGMADWDQRKPDDPGVALYFELDKTPYCLPCDRWTSVAGNLCAIAAHLEAIRGIERWGVGDLRAHFAGFQALPDPDRIIWRDVFGYEKGARPPRETLLADYQRLRSKHHPDKGGNADEFNRVMRAYEMAVQELGI